MNGKQLKNSILQWALQGKLVPQDPTDEPASVLLQRIREEKAKLVKEKKTKKDKNESIIYRGDDNSYYEKMVDTGEVKCIDEEIPFEVPEGWEWERWGNISYSIQYGYNAPAKPTGRIKMVRISDIQDNKVLWGTVPFCDIKEEEIETYILKENDILFARTGGTVGKSFLVSRVEEDAIYAGYLIRTRYSELLYPQYLKYFMESQLYWEQLRNGTTATAQPNCNGQILSRMLLPLPPYDEQFRIISRLNQVLEKVEKYTHCQCNLDILNSGITIKLRKSILQYAIQGKLVPQIESEGTAKELLSQIREDKMKLVKTGVLKKKNIVDSNIYKGDDNKYYENEGKKVTDITNKIPFDIPIYWQWCRLKTVSKIIGGYAFDGREIKSEVGIQVIKISDFDEYGWVKKNITYYKGNLDLYQYRLSTNDILIAMTGGTVGKSYHIGQLSKAMLLNQRVASIRVYDFSSYYLNIVIKSPFIQDVINDCKNSTNDNISMVDISNFLIPLPPLNEQKRIVAMIKNLFIKLK